MTFAFHHVDTAAMGGTSEHTSVEVWLVGPEPLAYVLQSIQGHRHFEIQEEEEEEEDEEEKE